jgi:hypothetical protein
MIRTTCATALLMLACINTGHAAEAEDELAACRAIEADAERVACYDAIAHGQVEEQEKENKGLAVVPAAAAIEVAASPAVTPSSDEDFGKTTTDDDLTRDPEEPESDDDDDQLTATVTSVRFYKRERVVFTLDNGQEWRQSSASTLRLDVGDEIVIRKGAFGSFNMAKQGSSRPMKVRRND